MRYRKNIQFLPLLDNGPIATLPFFDYRLVAVTVTIWFDYRGLLALTTLAIGAMTSAPTMHVKINLRIADSSQAGLLGNFAARLGFQSRRSTMKYLTSAVCEFPVM